MNKQYALGSNTNIPDYISKDAIDYWFKNENFSLLIKIMFDDREFNIGEMFDFTELNSKYINNRSGEFPFKRDISKDFENILVIRRKTYSGYTYKEGGTVVILTYELDFPNY